MSGTYQGRADDRSPPVRRSGRCRHLRGVRATEDGLAPDEVDGEADHAHTHHHHHQRDQSHLHVPKPTSALVERLVNVV